MVISDDCWIWLAGGVLMVEASKQVYAPTRGGRFAAPVPVQRSWSDGLRIWWREIDKVLVLLIASNLSV